MLALGYADIDAAIQKDIPLGNQVRLELREVFNLVNHVNFDVPNRVVLDAEFWSHLQRRPRPPDADRNEAAVLSRLSLSAVLGLEFTSPQAPLAHLDLFTEDSWRPAELPVIASRKLLDYSAQQDSFSGFLNREMAMILSASAIDGNTCTRSMKS